jgi:hypothetical protein
MPNDLTALTTEAATKMYKSTRESFELIWNASLANQEKATKLAQSYLEDAWTAAVPSDTKLVDNLLAHVKKGQEAGQELAQNYVAASLATLYFPVAVADQVLRPKAA